MHIYNMYFKADRQLKSAPEAGYLYNMIIFII